MRAFRSFPDCRLPDRPTVVGFCIHPKNGYRYPCTVRSENMEGANIMNKTIKDILFGFVVLLTIILMEFIVTIPFGLTGEEMTSAEFSAIMNREFLLTAIPAAVVTFIFAAVRKTRTQAEALQRSIIWTLMVFLMYFLMGMGNNNLGEIFSTPGIYVLLAATFAGPLIYARINHRGETVRRA